MKRKNWEVETEIVNGNPNHTSKNFTPHIIKRLEKKTRKKVTLEFKSLEHCVIKFSDGIEVDFYFSDAQRAAWTRNDSRNPISDWESIKKTSDWILEDYHKYKSYKNKNK